MLPMAFSNAYKGVLLYCLLMMAPAIVWGNKPVVIAYYSGNASQIDNYPVNKLTHIIYCFAQLRGSTLYVSPVAGTILNKLVSLKKKNAGLKILIGFAGWGGCKNCSPVFATATGRNEFAASVKELLDRYKLDGIDVDWEYPAIIDGPAGHLYSPEDKPNFTALVTAIRKAVGDKKEITFAAGAFSNYLENSIEWQKAMAVCDRVHLMSYDLVNRRSFFTGHHTPLYRTSFQRESIDYAVSFLDSLTIPRHKIALGIAFYARVYNDVRELNHGLFQRGKFQRFVVYKAYDNTFSEANGYTLYWDDEAKAPYAYNAKQQIFATFDDKRSAQLKTQYAIDKGLGGVMFWELRQDKISGGLLDAIYEQVK